MRILLDRLKDFGNEIAKGKDKKERKGEKAATLPSKGQRSKFGNPNIEILELKHPSCTTQPANLDKNA
jgi:hypothetical protein